MAAARFLVSGRVQGVFFRASAREKALTLGLSGSAINLPDGRVEVLAFGSPEAIDALERWLHSGPPAASVEQVLRLSAEESAGGAFRIG